MLDMCVHYIARRHHMLTDEHVEILDGVWQMYEPQELPPLPPSPPPERQHVHFVEYEQPDKEERRKVPSRQTQAEWPCDVCINQEVWECGRCVVPEQQQQEEEHQDDCDCSECEFNDAQEDDEWQEKRRATLADFATLQKEADYQAELRQEAEDQAEYYRQQREEQADALWHQIPQGAHVSQSMQHKETCGCDTCDWQDRRRAEEEAAAAEQEEQEQAQWRWRELHERQQEQYEQEQQLPCCSDYLRSCDAERCTYECGEACGSSPPMEQPVIDLTCDKASCEYGCDCKHEPARTAYPPPPIGSCLYGCAYSCGAQQGQDCCAQFDPEGNQLPPVVQSVVDAVIESDDYMPPLVRVGARATPNGWYNPEEDTEDETEIVDVGPPQPVKTPKAKPIFPYNHPRWPSPRAKALVQWMIRKGRTSKEAVSYAVKEPGGKSIKVLTHDICMRYLAKFYNLTHEELLEKTIYQLHNPDKHTPYWHICPCSFCKGGYSRGYYY